MRSRFVVFGAVPLTILTVTAGAAFTFGQDVSQVNGSQEQVDYVVMASNTTSSANSWTETSYIGDNPALTSGVKARTIATKYGELPQWFQVDSGARGVPSAVQEAGDLAFINAQSSTTTSDDTNNGRGVAGADGTLTDVVQALRIQGNITNVAALRQTYGSCLIPIRLWSTVDNGVTFTDVTQALLDTQLTDFNGTNGQSASSQNPANSWAKPFYVDCSTGEFSFTVPTAAAADNGGTATGTTPYHSTANLAYEVSVERGGTFGTIDNNTGAQPEFVVQATPVAYDPTNQFAGPGFSGNRQYSAGLPDASTCPYLGGDVASSWSAANPVNVVVRLMGCGSGYVTVSYSELIVAQFSAQASVRPDGAQEIADPGLNAAFVTALYSPDGRHVTAMRTPDLSGLTYAASIPGPGPLVEHWDADHPCLVVEVETNKFGYDELADCQSGRDSAVGGGGVVNPDGSVVIAGTTSVILFYATADGGGQPFGPIPVP